MTDLDSSIELIITNNSSLSNENLTENNKLSSSL